jgi:tyrosyl-tRNA synthetase
MSTSEDVSRHLQVLRSGAAEIVPEAELEEKLARSAREGRPLRVKLGIDPSTPDLHLGHAVVLGTLRRFQDLGHTAVLIVGDFTGRVGDPSGRPETRPMLSPQELARNAETYLDQARKILRGDRREVRRNSEWLRRMTLTKLLKLARSVTVAEILDREDFSRRFQAKQGINLVELLYPLMQAYDSVKVKADVELGGTDQRFNLFQGRELQRTVGQEPQVAFLLPLLPGTDGERKMSKTFGNQVGLTEPPEEQFGKTMSIPDGLIPTWFRLCTGLGPEELDAIERGLADGTLHPAEQKRRLAMEIVTRYHGAEAARDAAERFDRVHRQHEVPEDVPDVLVPREAAQQGSIYLPRLLVSLNLASSHSEARRLVTYGAVRIDGIPVSDANAEFKLDNVVGKTFQVGRRKFARVKGIAPAK